MDFFEGPVADPSDGVDNDRDSLIDAADTNQIGGEQIIMSRFVYYNNDGSNIGNPNNAQQYYNYLRGIWKDGSPLVYGGNGYQTSGADSCDFMFPGDTDPNCWEPTALRWSVVPLVGNRTYSGRYTEPAG